MSFSPVAGIHGVATSSIVAEKALKAGFSPVAGIHGVATRVRRAIASRTDLFQSRCRDSWGCDTSSSIDTLCYRFVSVPLPGFMGLRPMRAEDRPFCCVYRFSPVAGIHGVATHYKPWPSVNSNVSVPLPGFMGLRRHIGCDHCPKVGVSVPLPGFMGLRPSSIVAEKALKAGFSPVAGIHGVATPRSHRPNRQDQLFQSRCRDSWGCDSLILPNYQVQSGFSPVAGIHGVATQQTRDRRTNRHWFQSRCRDSWGCDLEKPDQHPASGCVSVPLPGFMGLRPLSRDNPL